MIRLPIFKWFINKIGDETVTNIYTGSHGTDGDTGCVDRSTLNYTVSVEVPNGDRPFFKCECLTKGAWDAGLNWFLFSKGCFFGTEEGLKQLEDWLNLQAAVFDACSEEDRYTHGIY